MEYCPFDIASTPERFGMHGQYVDTELGSLYLVSHPERTAHPTVFLHGVSMAWDTWTPLLQAAIATNVSITDWVFIDIPGFGKSDELTRPVDLDEVARVVIDALAQLGIRQFRLIGHSMGGFLTLHLASAFSDKVSDVVVVSGAYGTVVDIVNNPLTSMLKSPIAWTIYGSLSCIARLGRAGRPFMGVLAQTGLLRLGLFSVVRHPTRIKQSVLLSLADGLHPKSFLYAENTGRGYNVIDVWSQINVPVIAVFGAADGMVTANDRDTLESALPKAKCHTFDESGHLGHIEQPFEILALITQAR